MVTWNTHILSSEHQCTLPALITSVDMEKFVSSPCSSETLTTSGSTHPYLRAEASPQRHRIIQKCNRKYSIWPRLLPFVSLCFSHTHTAFLIFSYFSKFDVAIVGREDFRHPARRYSWTRSWTGPRLAIAHFLSKMCEGVIFAAGSVEPWRISLFCCCSSSLCSLNLRCRIYSDDLSGHSCASLYLEEKSLF